MKIRFSSFLLPPLSNKTYIELYRYKQSKHWANKGFYGTGGSIKKTIEYIEKQKKEYNERERL